MQYTFVFELLCMFGCLSGETHGKVIWDIQTLDTVSCFPCDYRLH